MNWLIIGGASALAKEIICLTKNDLEIMSTTRNPVNITNKCAFLDIADSKSIREFSPNAKPGIAIFCVAISSFAVCEAEHKRTHAINVTNTMQLAKQLSDEGWKIVYPSSSSVFDGSKPLETPQATVGPQTEYGKQKADIEEKLLALSGNTLIVRFTKIIFPKMKLFTDWAETLLQNVPITPYADYLFAPVCSKQGSAALIQLSKQNATGIWHISPNTEITYKEAAQILVENMNLSVELVRHQTGSDFLPPKEFPKHATLDASKTEHALGMTFMKPKQIIETWVEEFLKANNRTH